MRAWERQKVVRKDASTGDERLKCDSGVCGELGTKGNKMFYFQEWMCIQRWGGEG